MDRETFFVANVLARGLWLEPRVLLKFACDRRKFKLWKKLNESGKHFCTLAEINILNYILIKGIVFTPYVFMYGYVLEIEYKL